VTVPRTSRDRLYDLLPAVHRIADEAEGGELRAMLALINRQADDVRDDVRQLWDDFFIETSQHWVIPYIGDLVGNIPLHDLDVRPAAATAESLFTDLAGPDLAVDNPIPLRADVARTIWYRRRKGTPAMLERLATDVTGWDVRLVEFFELLDWNQHLEHLRLDSPGCPDLRSIEADDRIGGPWDSSAHTVDVRAINEREGWYGIRNVGFFLWRLRAMPRRRVMPRQIAATGWRFTFSPLGQDVPLYSAGNGPLTGSGRATELSIADAIRPAAFFEDMRAAHAPAPPPPPPSAYYGPEAAAGLVIIANGIEVPTSDIACANLSAWTTFAQPAGTQILVDPSRGRLALPAGRAGQPLLVTFCEGFSMDLGGGEYTRAKWLSVLPATSVSGGGTALATAIAARHVAAATVFRIDDSETYDLSADLVLNAGEALTIEAADGRRPLIRLLPGSIAVKGTDANGRLTLNGLLVEGGLRVETNLEALRILHSTLVPGRSVAQEAAAVTSPSLAVAGGPPSARLNTRLEVQVAFSIVGALRIPSHVTGLWLLDSIVDGIETAGAPKGIAIADDVTLPDKLMSGPPAHIERSTILGSSRFFDLEMASESIFGDVVRVDRRQAGCVRFSFVPPGSATPQQYRCQPALEVSLESERAIQAAKDSGTVLPPGWQAALETSVEAWLVPGFEADAYGRPAYAQLRRTSPIQVRTGAEDGSEMGAFCLLKQPQREANLRLRLDEYLPVGLDAGLITVT